MKVALEYLKDRYSEEQSRFDHFENKCSKFLTAVSIVIATLTAVAGMKNGALFIISTPLSHLIITAYISSAFCITCSWGHALLALRIGDCPTIPQGRQTTEYLIEVDSEAQTKHIYNCYIDTLEKLTKAINKKSRDLELAYNELVYSAWCIGLVAIMA
ncbi:hypothetical protein, partial [Pseudomonas sp. FW306-02-F08-AA]